MTAPRGVIFGLEEVLVRTETLHFQAWWVIADRLGIGFTRNDHERMRGLSRAGYLDAILALGSTEVSRTERELLADEKDIVFRELLRGLSPDDVAPGVVSTLAGLRRGGLRLAVASTGRHARVVLERTGLRDQFDAVSDSDGRVGSEPDPQVFLRAADFLALKPDECTVVVGTADGLEAACAGGFDTLSIGAAAAHPAATQPREGLAEALEVLVA